VFLTLFFGRRPLMNLFFPNPRIYRRMHDGPLGPCVDSYAAELRAEGYARHSAIVQIRLVADFSRWLAKRRISAREITAAYCQSYLRSRARIRHPREGDPAALKRLLKLLLRQGVIHEPPLPVVTPAAQLQHEFRTYLEQERSLAPATLTNYLPFVGEFLAEQFGAGPADLSCLGAADVTGFIQRRSPSFHSKRVQLMMTALRSFLRFARYRGDLKADLASCVPAVSNWSLSTIPRALPPAQVELVLASCKRQTAVSRRDYAILLLLARLGLRAGEIAGLTLEDLDWHEGLITLRGKGGRYSQLPLPVDVGKAIADYLRNGRPRAASRCVFLRAKAPIVGFKGQCAIGSVVKHALARAAIDSPRKGSHQFRHALACQMLRQGATLAEIGELLRHRSPETTAIYAKVDITSLATLALAWPGGGQ
jgi:site-specific recombinase XerD